MTNLYHKREELKAKGMTLIASRPASDEPGREYWGYTDRRNAMGDHTATITQLSADNWVISDFSHILTAQFDDEIKAADHQGFASQAECDTIMADLAWWEETGCKVVGFSYRNTATLTLGGDHIQITRQGREALMQLKGQAA